MESYPQDFFLGKKPLMNPTSSSSYKERTHGFQENCFGPAHGLSTTLQISQMCATLQQFIEGQTLHLLESIPLYGFCPTETSGKSPRYRSLFVDQSEQTLSHKFLSRDFTQHPVSFQPNQRLATLWRFCSDPHPPGSPPLYKLFLRSLIGSNPICSGFHRHRSLSFFFSMGQVPGLQGSRKIAHSLGSARNHPIHCHHYFWQGSRCQPPRSVMLRTQHLLPPRSLISGFLAPLYPPSNLSPLRHPNQKQFQIPMPLLSALGHIHRGPMQSNGRPRRILFPQGISRKTLSHSLSRSRSKQTYRLLNQQLHAARFDYHLIVPIPLADQNPFQMDQTVPSHQSLLWNDRGSGQDQNLNRYYGICVGSHY